MNRSLRKLLLITVLVLFSQTTSFANLCTPSGGGRSEPQNYSYEDLRKGISDQSFYFANMYKPDEAMANLGYFPPFSSCAAKKKKVIADVSVNPTKYGVNSMCVMSNWNDNVYYNFDNSAWAKYKALRGGQGDLVFTRGNGLGSDIIKRFSNWTHVAIVYDANNRKVFESSKNGGVQVSDTVNTWNDVTYYTCRRIKNIEMNQRKALIENAISKYRGTPYYPTVSTLVDLIKFVFQWSDKDDPSSMYCSKLVYKTFRDNINLDTNNTHVFNSMLQDKAPGAPFFSWIGVSPDDIYYSKSLDYDFCVSPNMYSL